MSFVKIAVVATHAGAPGTLASTAFIRAMMDGFAHTGVKARVIGLARHPSSWIAQAMEPFETSLPWMDHRRPGHEDIRAAASTGVFDNGSTGVLNSTGVIRSWNQEATLEGALADFAAGEDLIVMAYPRVFNILRMLARIAERRGWRLIVISTEALTDAQIDSATRDHYIRCTTQCADGIWVLSEHLADYWVSHGFPRANIMLNPPAVRRIAFDQTGEPVPYSATYVGNLQHREIDYLLDISQDVKSRLPEYHLTIYGDTTDKRRAELLQDIDERGLASTITVRPPVMPAEVPRILSTSWALVLPRSTGEFSTAGFPNKLGEYLASGRPVVVTGVGDIPKYLEDRRSALLVEPDRCEEFASALVEVLSDRTLAESVGTGGRQVAKDLLASEAVAGKILAFTTALPARVPFAANRNGLRRTVRAWLADWTIPFIRARSLATTLRYKLGLTRSGQYGLMVVKILIVKVLRALRLWPPAPKVKI